MHTEFWSGDRKKDGYLEGLRVSGRAKVKSIIENNWGKRWMNDFGPEYT
jgi:hypothetical protein